MSGELIGIPVTVKVVDGDKPGSYQMTIFHADTCPRVTSDAGDCNCDCSFGPMEFLYGPTGPN